MLVHQLIYQGSKEKLALCGKESITYLQLQDAVRMYRNYFYQKGIRQGTAVGLFSRNSVEFIYSYMAIVSLGAIVVPINFQLTAREIAYILTDAKISWLVTMTGLVLTEELHNCGYPGEVTQCIIPEFKTIVSKEVIPEAPLLDGSVNEEQACAIIYTSGTTGKPKGAVLTHRNLTSNAQAFKLRLPLTAEDNVLCVLPMYHCFAWTCAVLNALLAGAAITILGAFAPKETMAAIKEYQVTVLYGVPPMYNLLSRMGSGEELKGVRFFVSGGASLPNKVAQQFLEKVGVNIIEGYGLSEASPVVTLNPPGKTKPSSIGQPLPGLAVMVVNEQGKQQPIGVVGELVVKGPSVMKKYFNLPLETAGALRDGWLHTGDLAYCDEEGYLFLVDRLKDMLIINGENVYPREVEELLYAYPGIVEAAVIGAPDALRGQAVCAYIVAGEGYTLDKKLLKEYLQGRLAAYKIPRDILQVDSLPKNQTGKILKRVLCEQLATAK